MRSGILRIMSERMNPVHQMQQRLSNEFEGNQPEESLLPEYRRALGRVNFLKLSDIFSELEKKIEVNFRGDRSLASIEFFNEAENPNAGLYSPAGVIKLNVVHLESGLENVRKKYPGYDINVLREFAIVRNYIHELIHHYTNNITANRTVGFEVQIGNEGYFIAFNEAITELLSQYIFYKYVGDRFPMEGREKNIAYFEFSTVVRELLYLSIEDPSSALYERSVESAWFQVVRDFFDPNKRTENNFLYQTIKKLGPQFVLDFINLGSGNADEYEQSLTVSGLMRTIGIYRTDNGLQDFAFPVAA